MEHAKIPIPDQPNQTTQTRGFLRLDGDQDHFFKLIKGNDLLIHQTSSRASVFERQFSLFDPNVGKDVSNPFPSVPTERWLLNRSRTACLLVEGKQAVICDTLSAKMGEPKVLARHPWADVLAQVRQQARRSHFS